MITGAAVKRIARERGIDPVVIDRDHALGVVLAALAVREDLSTNWVFKGGTCLRKMHFADYRFSEDLDFTAEARVAVEDVRARITAVAGIARPLGVDLAVADARIEVVDDSYGRESVQARVPYQGALRMGSRPAIQFHISADEKIALPPETRSLLHDYEDADTLEGRLRCYRLEEILAEKLRAVGGQRRFAVARDLYDIGQLVERGADVDVTLAVLPAKARLKGVNLSLAYETLVGRRAEFRASWDRTLAYLVDGPAEFEAAWFAATQLLARAGVR